MIIYYLPGHANSWLWCPLADYYVVIIIPTSLYTHLNATKDNAAQREFRLSYHRRIQEINSFIGFSTSHHDWNFITKSNNFNILPFTGLKWNHHVRRYKVFLWLRRMDKITSEIIKSTREYKCYWWPKSNNTKKSGKIYTFFDILISYSQTCFMHMKMPKWLKHLLNVHAIIQFGWIYIIWRLFESFGCFYQSLLKFWIKL